MFWLWLGLALTAGPLSFEDALSRAVSNPEVVALARARHERSHLRSRMSRMTWNPVIQVQPGVRDMKQGGTGSELYLTVMQRFSTSRLGKKRERSVDLELRHDEAQQLALLRSIRREVADAWLQRWAAQQSLELTRAEVSAAHALEKQLEQALSSGEATRIDVGQARSFCAELELVVLAQEGRAFEAGVHLSRVLGEVGDAPRAVHLELPRIDLPIALESELTKKKLESAPSVLAARAATSAEEARLAEVKAARAPSMAVGAMGWREGAGDVAGVLTLEAEIPVFDRGERERSTQAAQLALLKGAEAESVVEANAERLLVVHEVEHTAAVVASIERGLVSSLEDVANAQKTRLDAREGTVLEWVLARRALLEAKARAVDAHAAEALARFLASEWFLETEGNTP